MNGSMDAFEKVFGDVTISDTLVFIMAFAFLGSFLYFSYKKLKAFLEKRTELMIQKRTAEKKRDEEFKSVLEVISNYPKYRQQSLQIQKELTDQIDDIRKQVREGLVRIEEIEAESRRRDRNKIRDRLLQSYRHYTDKERNPDQSWTAMEAEAFWELFGDYEELDGNGYMHTVVQPAMNLLTVIDNH